MNTIPPNNIPGLDRPFYGLDDQVLAEQMLQTEQQIQAGRRQALYDATAFETLRDLQNIFVFLNEETLARSANKLAA